MEADRQEKPFRTPVPGDIPGAFGDLGTFLPLAVAILAAGHFSAAPLLFGFGVFAIATGLYYRRPVPVQPMKAVAALLILGQLGPEEAAATGILVGAALVLLAASGLISRLNRIIPLSVLLGIQLGLGLSLVAGAAANADGPLEMLTAFALAAALVAATRTRFGPAVAAAALLGGFAWLAATAGLPPLTFALPVAGIHLPAPDGFLRSLTGSVLPQLALTLTNAVLLTSFVAADCFPGDRDRLTPGRLALFSGLLNMILAPFGALPMCHGAGGLPAQVRLGARSGLAPVIFGSTCLVLAFCAGANATLWLALVPPAVLGALLAFAGYQLVNAPKLASVRSDCYPAIAITALCCLLVNPAIGLMAGLLVELLRNAWANRRAAR